MSAPTTPRGTGTPPTGGGEKYGQRTVAVMIQQALARAGLARSGTSKPTAYFEALVEKRVRSTSRRLKWTIAILVTALALAGAGLGVHLYRNRSVRVYQTTQYNWGDAAGGSIAAANRYSVFLLAGYPLVQGRAAGPLQGFCTAFAIGPDLLATNAHCVLEAGSGVGGLVALMNGAPGHTYPVAAMVSHPAYVTGTISPDVGLVRIEGRLPYAVTLASGVELSQVAPGAPVFLYGFPGRLNKEEAPEATFIKGDIGRVTAFDQRLGDLGSNTLIQHSAYSSTGTSGSPMFNSAGHVIGINAGGYTEGNQILHGYNFGMRIDLVYQLYPLLDGRVGGAG